MKFPLLVFLLTAGMIFPGCEYDTAPSNAFEYHAHIHAPDVTTKHLGDTLHIEIEFESHTGMNVDLINVRIYDAASGAEVYSKPENALLQGVGAIYVFDDELVLSTSNGFMDQTNYILAARVWTHANGLEEETEEVGFLVVE
jgi:hypothetical protein